ncbi:MAG TPA: DNA translocase FtsK [Desulfobacteria bacterium]|nr:DNA translocase FtsK [Desulfobacteria bacterium]
MSKRTRYNTKAHRQANRQAFSQACGVILIILALLTLVGFVDEGVAPGRILANLFTASLGGAAWLGPLVSGFVGIYLLLKREGKARRRQTTARSRESYRSALNQAKRETLVKKNGFRDYFRNDELLAEDEALPEPVPDLAVGNDFKSYFGTSNGASEVKLVNKGVRFDDFFTDDEVACATDAAIDDTAATTGEGDQAEDHGLEPDRKPLGFRAFVRDFLQPSGSRNPVKPQPATNSTSVKQAGTLAGPTGLATPKMAETGLHTAASSTAASLAAGTHVPGMSATSQAGERKVTPDRDPDYVRGSRTSALSVQPCEPESTPGQAPVSAESQTQARTQTQAEIKTQAPVQPQAQAQAQVEAEVEADVNTQAPAQNQAPAAVQNQASIQTQDQAPTPTPTPTPTSAQVSAPITLPASTMLDPYEQTVVEDPNLQKNAVLLQEVLNSFGVKVTVADICQGPVITRYEVQPAPGVKISKILGLTDDIALGLATQDIRIEAPIPGKAAVGIEVPNKHVALVKFREVLESDQFKVDLPLRVALGKDIAGQCVVANLAKMPHLLVAGATGSGKSVCMNTIITSILFTARPDQVKLLLIDPKMVELAKYNGVPHLIAPVVTEAKQAAAALRWIVTEMETRYELFAACGARDIIGYNKANPDKPPLPYVVVLIDELADLMMVSPGDVEEAVCRLAQMARAAGIHLVIATQRPSVDVITGIIKANIPSRIAFAVSSQIDSRTILDSAGAIRCGTPLYLANSTILGSINNSLT